MDSLSPSHKYQPITKTTINENSDNEAGLTQKPPSRGVYRFLRHELGFIIVTLLFLLVIIFPMTVLAMISGKAYH